MKTAYLTELFESQHALIALFNPELQEFTRINEHGTMLFDMPGLEVFADHFKSGEIWVDPPADLQRYVSNMLSPARTYGYLLTEACFKTATGKTFWALLEIEPFSNNKEDLLLVRIKNINHIKDGTFHAAPTSQQLHALFNNSTLGIVITNEEGYIINFNEFAEEQFGYTKPEVLGRPIQMLIPGHFREKHKAYTDAFSHHPENKVMGAGRNLFALKKDQTEFPVEISLSYYQSEGELHVMAFVIDITIRKASDALVLSQKEELLKNASEIREMNVLLERKVEDRTVMLREALVELEESRQELGRALSKEQELGELKSRFVTIASHEFRTPLSTILSSSFIIQQYSSAEDQHKRVRHLDKINLSVNTLTIILEDFLSLEKLEKGFVLAQIELLKESDFVACIENTIDEMSPMLKAGQQIVFKLEDYQEFLTDKKLIKNILINLLSNAIKYSGEDSEIRVTGFIADHTFRLSVSDQGIGIPEEEQVHLFEKFFRATNASEVQGTGLGLNIVTRYLSLINGRIEMKSALNEGTVFTIISDLPGYQAQANHYPDL